ncbi:MAG: hypothetical protein HRU04_05485 [Oceanospirillaceae bacterium]|nr:hypothetical protein [Oceanospirillaceae bacterium]
MQEAISLKDLLIIRNANRAKIEAINGNLGSALGIKKTTNPNDPENGKPAILVFVPQKIAPKWVEPNQQIPKKMTGPGGLYCCVDVVEGSKLTDYNLLFQDAGGNSQLVNWTTLRGLPELSDPQLKIRDQLRGWGETITPGAQIAAETIHGGWYGTLACFACERNTEKIGLVTNQHVANKVGQSLYFASTKARKLATVTKTFEYVTDEKRFGGLINEAEAFYRIDCAFAPLDQSFNAIDFDPRIPVIQEDGTIVNKTMGGTFKFDIETMNPIGQRVIGVGRTMSHQKGTITAFGYEFQDENGVNLYTDYLIVGDDPSQFSAPGDSGKLILTDEEEPRPIALLWGGWIERLSNHQGQRDWTYAIDINFVLDTLDVDIIK